MRGPTSIARRLVMCGSVAFVLGGALVGAAAVAGATGPAITLSDVPAGGFPTTAPFSAALIDGTGFVPKSYPWVMECNVTTSGTGEPTMSATVYPTPGKSKNIQLTVPVGCSQPSQVDFKVDSSGNLTPTAALVSAGTVGPPATGNDSTGASGATDAANYPCPPYVSQAGTNVCQIEVIEQDGTVASAPVTFAGSNSTPDTTIPAATTTAPCDTINGTITAPVTGVTTGSGTATVTQTGGAAPTSSDQAATCVLGGETVQVSASGLSVGTVAGGLYTLIECSSVPGQPTIDYTGHPVPVSCTAIGKTSLFPLSTNSFSNTPFTIVQGITGPPVVGTDSSGGSSVTDAEAYPCPPTAAQAAAGATCVIAVGTAYLSGTPTNTDQLPVTITFNANELGNGTTSNNAATAAANAAAAAKTKAKTASTKASSSSLAFTGAGPGLWWLGTLGVLLMILGGLVLVVVEGPRRFLRFAADHGRRAQGDETS